MSINRAVIEVESLGVAIDGNHILHDITFEVQGGEFLAILGHNGSGKSTLIRTLLGLQRHTGSVSLFGTPQNEFRSWQRIGYLSQDNDHTTGVPSSVEEVVLSGTMAKHRWFGWPTRSEKHQAHDLIERVGLGAHIRRPVSQLSGGQRQRARIARALIGAPELIIMDEPTVGVDAQSLEILNQILAEEIQRGASIVMVTHELGIVRNLVNRTITLEAGKICDTCDNVMDLHAASLRDHYEEHHADSHSESDAHHVPEHDVRPVVAEGPLQ